MSTHAHTHTRTPFSICLSEPGLLHLTQCLRMLFISYGWIRFCCPYVPYFLYPVICWWTSRVGPFLSFWEKYSSKHGCADMYVVGPRVLWVCTGMEKFYVKLHTDVHSHSINRVCVHVRMRVPPAVNKHSFHHVCLLTFILIDSLNCSCHFSFYICVYCLFTLNEM